MTLTVHAQFMTSSQPLSNSIARLHENTIASPSVFSFCYFLFFSLLSFFSTFFHLFSLSRFFSLSLSPFLPFSLSPVFPFFLFVSFLFPFCSLFSPFSLFFFFSLSLFFPFFHFPFLHFPFFPLYAELRSSARRARREPCLAERSEQCQGGLEAWEHDLHGQGEDRPSDAREETLHRQDNVVVRPGGTAMEQASSRRV